VDRRKFVEAGGRVLAGLLLLPGSVRAPSLARRGRVLEIRMRSDVRGEHVWFDPIGVLVDPGTVIRWVVEANVHATAAYHPANGGRPRRIPVGSTPWDSGYLVNPGDAFQVTLTVPGVYDYYCLPHEQAGMVGRIVVGRPPFRPDALPADSPAIPDGARANLPAVERIVRERVVRAG
jgi:plastocyanin